MVHFAARGGLPSAMESSQFGYTAMTEVMNTIESVRSQKNPATGRARSTAEVLRESARLLADPRSPEGQKFRQSTRGLQFQATFQRLPIYARDRRSEEHTSELQSLMRISYAVFCLKKKNTRQHDEYTTLLVHSLRRQ